MRGFSDIKPLFESTDPPFRIVLDDGCYVVLVPTLDGVFITTPWIFPAALEAMKRLTQKPRFTLCNHCLAVTDTSMEKCCVCGKVIVNYGIVSTDAGEISRISALASKIYDAVGWAQWPKSKAIKIAAEIVRDNV